MQKQKPIVGFDIAAYQLRLRILREVISGENQQDFSERVGIDKKRWNNYERGYPVPREIAFMLMHKFPGISVEWIWFGMTGNLSKYYLDRITTVEAAMREERKAGQALQRAADRVKEAADKRKRAVRHSSSR